MTPGKVILVGAGPGDPELLTLRGQRALAGADVVIYDYLANPGLLELAPAAAEKIYVGKKGGEHSSEQDEINQLLVTHARAGRTVVRLKGGDPYVFGRGSEEIAVLHRQGIPFEVVPGIPSAVGMGAFAGIPLTDRRHASQVTLVTGNEDPTKPDSAVRWDLLARLPGTLVVYMGVRNLEAITTELRRHGMADTTPVSVVEWATTPRQRVVTGTLADIVSVARAAKVQAPALLVFGGVNNLRPELAWFEKLPLFGRRIVVTRSREQAGRLNSLLRERGAEVLEAPVISIQPPESLAPLDEALRRLSTYQWVVFTSVNAVDAVAQRLNALGLDARAYAGVRLAAIGSATAERLALCGLRADLVPHSSTGRELFEELAAAGLANCRLLMPRSDIATPELPELCAAAGVQVDDIVAYRTVPAVPKVDNLRQELASNAIAAVTFTSSSTVRNFIAALGADFLTANRDKFRPVSIGPVTSATLRELGFPPTAEATTHDIPGLVGALEGLF